MGRDAPGAPPVSGWEKVIAAMVLAVIGLVGLNLAIWRRLRVGAGKPSGGQVEDERQRVIQSPHVARREPTDDSTDPIATDRTKPVGHRL